MTGIYLINEEDFDLAQVQNRHGRFLDQLPAR